MTIEQYQKEILRTVNPDMFKSEKQKEDQLKNFSISLAEEVGELLGILKKRIYHDHKLDMKELKLEAGDVLWYLLNILNAYHIDVREVLEMNIVKLLRRYPNGFNVNASIERDILKEMNLEYIELANELEEDVKK